jgi:hypothetical protein
MGMAYNYTEGTGRCKKMSNGQRENTMLQSKDVHTAEILNAELLAAYIKSKSCVLYLFTGHNNGPRSKLLPMFVLKKL